MISFLKVKLEIAALLHLDCIDLTYNFVHTIEEQTVCQRGFYFMLKNSIILLAIKR